MDDIRVPIYLVTGFLESGKTTFLDFTLQQDYFAIDGKTLLILCEEGEEEYDMDKLKLTNTVIEVIEDEEDLTPQRLAAMDIIHQPERVVIEYNGMWLVSFSLSISYSSSPSSQRINRVLPSMAKYSCCNVKSRKVVFPLSRNPVTK